jgi:hypothetical protein
MTFRKVMFPFLSVQLAIRTLTPEAVLTQKRMGIALLGGGWTSAVTSPSDTWRCITEGILVAVRSDIGITKNI